MTASLPATTPVQRRPGRGPGGRRVGEVRIGSLPNVVTTIRIVLVPMFVWLLVQPDHTDWFAAAVLLVAGPLARVPTGSRLDLGRLGVPSRPDAQYLLRAGVR